MYWVILHVKFYYELSLIYIMAQIFSYKSQNSDVPIENVTDRIVFFSIFADIWNHKNKLKYELLNVYIKKSYLVTSKHRKQEKLFSKTLLHNEKLYKLVLWPLRFVELCSTHTLQSMCLRFNWFLGQPLNISQSVKATYIISKSWIFKVLGTHLQIYNRFWSLQRT